MGNFTRPCGKRHFLSLSHLVDHFSFDAIDHVPSNIPEGSFPASLHILEDNAAVIRMIIECRSPYLRLLSRNHRVDLEWLICTNHFGQFNVHSIRARHRTVGRHVYQRCGHLWCSCSTFIHHTATLANHLVLPSLRCLMPTMLSATSTKGLGNRSWKILQQELRMTPLGVKWCHEKAVLQSELKIAMLSRHNAFFGTRRRRTRRFLGRNFCRKNEARKRKKSVSKPCGEASGKHLSLAPPRSRKGRSRKPR